jgi:hypothetical protein
VLLPLELSTITYHPAPTADALGSVTVKLVLADNPYLITLPKSLEVIV